MVYSESYLIDAIKISNRDPVMRKYICKGVLFRNRGGWSYKPSGGKGGNELMIIDKRSEKTKSYKIDLRNNNHKVLMMMGIKT